MHLVQRLIERTLLKRMTQCPECRRSVVPVETTSGRECPACGTRWQPRHTGRLHVVRGGIER